MTTGHIMSETLKQNIGVVLASCLQELIEVRPTDPIYYIAQWLYSYSNNNIYYTEKALYLKKLECKARELRVEKRHANRALAERRAQVSKLQAELPAAKTSCASGSQLSLLSWRRFVAEQAAFQMGKDGRFIRVSADSTDYRPAQGRKQGGANMRFMLDSFSSSYSSAVSTSPRLSVSFTSAFSDDNERQSIGQGSQSFKRDTRRNEDKDYERKSRRSLKGESGLDKKSHSYQVRLRRGTKYDDASLTASEDSRDKYVPRGGRYRNDQSYLDQRAQVKFGAMGASLGKREEDEGRVRGERSHRTGRYGGRDEDVIKYERKYKRHHSRDSFDEDGKYQQSEDGFDDIDTYRRSRSRRKSGFRDEGRYFDEDKKIHRRRSEPGHYGKDRRGRYSRESYQDDTEEYDKRYRSQRSYRSSSGSYKRDGSWRSLRSDDSDTSYGSHRSHRSADGTLKSHRSSDGTHRSRRSSYGTYRSHRSSDGVYRSSRSSDGTFRSHRSSDGTYRTYRSSDGTYTNQHFLDGTYRSNRSSDGNRRSHHSLDGVHRSHRNSDQPHKRDGSGKRSRYDHDTDELEEREGSRRSHRSPYGPVEKDGSRKSRRPSVGSSEKRGSRKSQRVSTGPDGGDRLGKKSEIDGTDGLKRSQEGQSVDRYVPSYDDINRDLQGVESMSSASKKTLLRKKSSKRLRKQAYQTGLCSWYLLGSPSVIVCSHPILGNLCAPHLYRAAMDTRTDAFTKTVDYPCEVHYDQEVYTVCDPNADDESYVDKMLEWTGETWIM